MTKERYEFEIKWLLYHLENPNPIFDIEIRKSGFWIVPKNY